MRTMGAGICRSSPRARPAARGGSPTSCRPASRAGTRGWPGQHLVQNRAEREDVGSVVGGNAADLLRRHVAERSEHHSRLRARRIVGTTLPTAPIGSGSVSLARPKSRIFTRSPAVMNMFSGFRSRWTIPLSCAAARPCADLRGVVHGLAHRKRTVLHALTQRLALEQLRHDVRRSGVVPDVEDRQNIRVVQGRRGASFQFETVPAIGVARDDGGENLDGDITSEPRIPGPIHLAHRPGPDQSAATSYGPSRAPGVTDTSLPASIRRWLERY